MNSNFISFPVTDFKRIKQQVLNWANQFSTCCFLDNNQYQFNHHTYECVAAAGVVDSICVPAGHALQQLQQFQEKHAGWLFGHLGYDLKNEIEDLHSSHPDNIGFPDLFFFVPETVILVNETNVLIAAASPILAARVFDDLSNRVLLPTVIPKKQVDFQPVFSKQSYIDRVEKLREHMLRGDCYEVNFCQAFFAQGAAIEPVQVYQLLSEISPAPFAAFYKLKHQYLLCASPERYLKKDGDSILSQPIKGTGKRDLMRADEDARNKMKLYESAKDRSENVMVVDLVRNDLSRICLEGSVTVDELYGIYSFPQVHQMISTIRGALQPGIGFTDIISKTFPMGSMTGAPKKKVMQLIEEYEAVRRGIFSGAVGYIAPGGDFDFNVIIRSLLYNSSTQYLTYLVGSGITFYSNAEDEYEECLLKAAAMKKLFL